MTKRSRWVALHGLVRLSLGVALIVNEGIVRPQAQIDVLATGLSLLVLPEAVRFDRWLIRARKMAEAATSDEDQADAAR